MINNNGIRVFAKLGALKLSRLLCGKIPEDLEKRFEHWLERGISDEEIAKKEYSSLIEGEGSGPEDKARLLNLSANCECGIALTLMELIMLRTIDPSVSELLEQVCPGNGAGVTLLTAAKASGFTSSIDEAIPDMTQAERSARFLLHESENGEEEFYRKPWTADKYLLNYLSGGDLEDEEKDEYTERFDPEGVTVAVYGMEKEADGLYGQMKSLLDREVLEPFTVLVEGEKESGRYTVVKAAALRLGLPLLAVDTEYLINSNDPRKVIRYLVRCSVLEGRALCLRNIGKTDDTVFLVGRLSHFLRRHSLLPLFLLSDHSVKLKPLLKESFIGVRIPDSRAVNLALWKGFLPEGYADLAESLSSKMKLTAGQMKRVMRSCETALNAGEELDEHKICRFCYEVLDDGRYDNVKWVEPGFGFDDLKIDQRSRAVLKDICDQVELRHKVYEEWGLRDMYAYGRCVSVIFAGSPGTGKTMAVHALASRLGLELYKVDLSQIVDKYVGETEKRLEEVFDKAQKSNMILFFDEADAVMGKRSEVKDAQDKYANTEISFILQRIEEYDGIVILATNNLHNIDHAFMRRIRYVLNFALPEKTTREAIWREAFGEGVPLSDDIDYDYLAEKFELSGGEIKNIVLNAVFYGAADGGRVTMKHIMKAVYRELTKARRVALSGDYTEYGEYGYLLTDQN